MVYDVWIGKEVYKKNKLEINTCDLNIYWMIIPKTKWGRGQLASGTKKFLPFGNKWQQVWYEVNNVNKTEKETNDKMLDGYRNKKYKLYDQQLDVDINEQYLKCTNSRFKCCVFIPSHLTSNMLIEIFVLPSRKGYLSSYHQSWIILKMFTWPLRVLIMGFKFNLLESWLTLSYI